MTRNRRIEPYCASRRPISLRSDNKTNSCRLMCIIVNGFDVMNQFNQLGVNVLCSPLIVSSFSLQMTYVTQSDIILCLDANITTGNQWHDPRVASLFIEETELVGIEHAKEDLVGRLVAGESKNLVISIVGMGGLGKTTLAKRVYDDPRITTKFDCQAWITVSRSYKTDEILKSMIKQLHHTKKVANAALEGIDTMGEVSLINNLREYLAGKRYLVVFDDVWKIDFWGYIKLALSDNSKSSRIMFTTRNEDVAPSFRESPFYHVHKLEPLPHQEAFDLFCKRAFSFEGGYCPQILMDLSHAITERCGGLPLAIVTIGGLLATKDKIVTEWKRLYDGLSSTIVSDQCLTSDLRLASITRVLSLSYHDLPYSLKTCFLYLGLFPEDYSVDCSKLVQLWITQGFIKEKQGMTLEDVGKEYISELSQRNLVQLRKGIHDTTIKCHVHDLIRDIILSRSEELELLSLSRYDRSTKKRCRHLSICGQIDNLPEGVRNYQVRSLILLKLNELPESSIGIFFSFKLLRALYFEHVPVDHIPEEVGDLWHLMYLSLRHTNVKVLPKSIGRLSNLEAIDTRNSPIYDLPFEINDLLKLQRILAYFDNCDDDFSPNTRRGVKILCSIGHLEALEKLSFIEANNGIDLINGLARLTKLQMLGLKNLRTEDGLALCNALEKMSQLRILKIHSTREEEFLILQSLSCPPPLLQRLYLSGPLEALPQCITKLKHLAKISLCWSRLGDEAFQVLQAISNLREIWLYKAYDGKQLHFSEGSFGKIKVLSLQCLVGLNRLLLEEGALPSIKELQLGPFPQLTEFPSIHFLRDLKILVFFDLQRDFVINMLPEGGRDYWKIEHIPSVLFHYKTTCMKYETYKLGDPDLLKRLNGSNTGTM